MSEFISALFSPNAAFLRYAVLTGMLASVAFGMVGTFVVVRRISYLAGAIAHSVLGGIGAALYCQHKFNLPWLDPVLGAAAAAIVSALVIGIVSRYAHQREDTVIGALWAIGMAVGLVFLYKTPTYTNAMSYLFGDILMLSKGDVWLVAILDAVVVGVALLFYHKILAVCFEEEFTYLRGVRVDLYYMLLLCLTALTVVLLVRVVGIIMVVALLTLPPAVAGYFARRLWQMMSIAVVLCLFFTTAGLGISYGQDLPATPCIILLAGGVYLLVVIGSGVRKMLRSYTGRQVSGAAQKKVQKSKGSS